MTPDPIRCHCGAPATGQFQREATADETAAYHRSVDESRRSRGLDPMPDDAPARTVPVMVPVFHCDTHGPAPEVVL